MKVNTHLSRAFIEQVLFVLFAVGMAFLVFKLMTLWLLVFGAVLMGQILRVLAEPMFKYTPMPEALAIVISLALLILAISLASYIFGRDLITQLNALIAQIPDAWAAFNKRLLSESWGSEVLEQINSWGAQGSKALSIVPSIASDIIASLTNLLVVIVGGVFMAINSRAYSQGVVAMFPADQRLRVADSFKATGKALRRWLLGQSISMVLVGSLVATGLSLLGVPSSMALGLIAGLAQFVPIVGPVIATVPGLIMAGAIDWQTMGYALILYTAISQLEANLITPLVQQSVTEVPTALTLFAVIGFAMLLGPLGIIFASPLTVVLYTLVKKFYRDNGWHKPEAAPDLEKAPETN